MLYEVDILEEMCGHAEQLCPTTAAESPPETIIEVEVHITSRDLQDQKGMLGNLRS